MKTKTNLMQSVSMKNKIVMGLGAIFILAAVVFGWVYLKDKLNIFSSYDAKSPTAEKFAMIDKWIKPSSDFWAVADIPQMLKDEQVGAPLRAYLTERHGLAGDLVESVLNGQSGVGMVALVSDFVGANAKTSAVLVMQGNFDKKVLAVSVKELLKKEGEEVAEEELAGRKVYFEKSEDPFGFMFLDENHMAIGSKSSFVTFFGEAPFKVEEVGSEELPVIFGKIGISDRVKPLLPHELAEIKEISFASTDAKTITADINCSSEEKASSVRMFIEGMRSLMMLKNEGLPLAASLQKIKVTSNGTEVYISSGVTDVFGLGF